MQRKEEPIPLPLGKNFSIIERKKGVHIPSVERFERDVV
jgi:hypothetical protein